MADMDYLLAAATGILQGVEKGYVPFKKMEVEDALARKRKQEEQQMEMDTYKQKLPLEEASKIRVDLAKPITPTYIVDNSGAVTGKVGGRVSRSPNVKGPRKIITSAQAEQLRSAGVDVNDQEYKIQDAPAGVEKDANKVDDAEWAISEISRILPLNERSSGGFVGGIRQKGMSALNIEDEKFRNTADVVNSARSLVARVLKSTFGGQLSDSEREYLNSVYGAMPNYSVAERRIALNNVKRMAEKKLTSRTLSSPSVGSNTGGLTPDEEIELQSLEKEFGGK